MSAKALDWYVWSNLANSTEDCAKSAAGHSSPNRVMADNYEKINWLGVVQRFLEPWLLNHVSRLDDLGDVAVAGEVKEHAKSHDAKTWGPVSTFEAKSAIALPCSVVK